MYYSNPAAIPGAYCIGLPVLLPANAPHRQAFIINTFAALLGKYRPVILLPGRIPVLCRLYLYDGSKNLLLCYTVVCNIQYGQYNFVFLFIHLIFMLQQDEEGIILIIAGTIMLLMLGMFIISFLFFYQKKHNAHLSEKSQLQAKFDQEMLKAQLEIQEQTLTYISREIHDNIGQVLSFVKLSLASAKTPDEKQNHKKIDENRELISQAINDLRDLSKSLSFERIKSLGLETAIESELERVNKSGLVKANLNVIGQTYKLGVERELVLFRIFQEGLNNALKHAHARNLYITLNYTADLFTLTIDDDGAGFSVRDKLKDNGGSGLKNMDSRAALIGGSATIDSTPGKGCCIKITIDPITYANYAEGIYTNSPG
ncbi:MAG: sensor histidine kinase [Sphingobacteriaceae bacterium]|nr:MAG: sensor histidine kinase [Sphingobacteriaceae bacterium]